jgi:antitoxin FitA
MQSACTPGTVDSMSTLQVRGVPEEVRVVLKRRAAEAGMSLSEYVLRELTHLASQPTLEEFIERVQSRGSTEPETSAADVLAAERRR